jgi:peptide/nickel transport system substrate-binding protein
MKPKSHIKVSVVLSLVIALSMILGACATQPAATPQVIVETKVVEKVVTEVVTEVVEVVKEVTPVPPSEYSEAPLLKEMVDKGELPAVDERLPENPLIVLPVDSVGQYGGTWHRAFLGNNDFHAFGRLIYEAVLRWPRNPADPIQPGLAEAWEWSDDGKVLTLHLREGLKWSDGAPFTVDDITFWWEAIETDTNVTASIHAEWVVKANRWSWKNDDLTIKLKFDAPNGLAETVGLAFHGNEWPLGFERFGFFSPRHYLEQFHPKFNKDATYEIFEAKAWEYNPERPAMTPWVITDWVDGADHMTATRNPYYWKVDVEGNQLPYIDEVYFYLVEDVEAVNTLALQGKLDQQHRGMDLAKYTLFQENAEAGDYQVFLWPQAQASGLTFFPNQSFKDEKYRTLPQTLKFRRRRCRWLSTAT